jgi:hypothetical protein
MKAVHVVVAVIALVVGIAVGGLGPRAEVRALRAQLDEAGDCAGGAVGSEIANVFRGRPWEEGEGTSGRRVIPANDGAHPPDAGPPLDSDTPKGEPDPEGFRVNWSSGDGEDQPANPEEAMKLAREAMELRYAQARAALLEDAKPSDDQLATIDGAMERMNDQLVGLARDLVDQVKDGGEPSRRDTMLFAAETLDVLLTAEGDLRGALTEEQLGAMQDESLDPLSYVDPAIVDLLAELNP